MIRWVKQIIEFPIRSFCKWLPSSLKFYLDQCPCRKHKTLWNPLTSVLNHNCYCSQSSSPALIGSLPGRSASRRNCYPWRTFQQCRSSCRRGTGPAGRGWYDRILAGCQRSRGDSSRHPAIGIPGWAAGTGECWQWVLLWWWQQLLGVSWFLLYSRYEWIRLRCLVRTAKHHRYHNL